MAQAYLDLSHLHQLLLAHFDYPDLRQLCIDLAFDPNQLNGERPNRNRLARALVLTCHRTGTLEQLLSRCAQVRPQNRWPQGEAPPVFSGLFIPDYADVLPRIIAFIIDIVIVVILAAIANAVFYSLVMSIQTPGWLGELRQSAGLFNIVDNFITLARRVDGPPDSDMALVMFSLNVLLTVLVTWLYFAGAESSTTQATTGKQWLRLKVANARGQRISLGRATVRFLFKVLSLSMAGLPFLLTLSGERHQGIHDRVSRTYVVTTG